MLRHSAMPERWFWTASESIVRPVVMWLSIDSSSSSSVELTFASAARTRLVSRAPPKRAMRTMTGDGSPKPGACAVRHVTWKNSSWMRVS